MKLVTGNDLATGDVIWWTGSGWSRHVADAVDAGTDGDAIVAREEAALRVNVAYVTDGADGPDGPMPLNIKQRIRALGPTVHPRFAVKASRPPFVPSEVEGRVPGAAGRVSTSLDTNG